MWKTPLGFPWENDLPSRMFETCFFWPTSILVYPRVNVSKKRLGWKAGILFFNWGDQTNVKCSPKPERLTGWLWQSDSNLLDQKMERFFSVNQDCSPHTFGIPENVFSDCPKFHMWEFNEIHIVKVYIFQSALQIQSAGVFFHVPGSVAAQKRRRRIRRRSWRSCQRTERWHTNRGHLVEGGVPIHQSW